MGRNCIRLIAVLFAAFAAAMVLPPLVGRIIPSPGGYSYVKVVYAERLGDFLVSQPDYGKDAGRPGGVEWTIRDTHGNEYTADAVDTLAVLENASQLIFEGRLPATLCGVGLTPEEVSAADFTMYFGDRGDRSYGLMDLPDQLSYRSQDYRTDDLFRFAEEGIEFIDAAENRVDREKSLRFREALDAAGFVRPCAWAWKPTDAADAEALGYFLLDARGCLYRMGMCGGEPDVEPIALPGECRLRNLSFCGRPELLALALADDGTLYRMDRDLTFRRLELPPARNLRVAMHSTLLFRKFVYERSDRTDYYVTDLDFRMLDSCTVAHPPRRDLTRERIINVLFPLTVRLTPWQGLRFAGSEGWGWALLNLVWCGVLALLLRRRGESLRNPFVVADLVVTLLLGLYGLIGVLAIPGLGTERNLKKRF